MSPESIFLPIFGFIALMTFVLLQTAKMRTRLVRSKQVSVSYYRTFNGEPEIPEQLRQYERHFKNLMELPILFYLVLVLLYVTESVGALSLLLAWAYFLVRLGHSYIHLTYNNVVHRFIAFGTSCFVLLLLWLDALFSIYF